MTVFLIVASTMALAALTMLLWPILRRTSTPRRWPAIAIALLILPLSAALYAALTNWDWRQAVNPQTPADIEYLVEKLETRLQTDKTSVEGWLLLGRTYFQLGRYYKSADAYQQAYALTQGNNVEALLGLAEALSFADETLFTGRAAGLFERALQLQPDHPKALWYSGLVAYQTEQLAQARDRWQRLAQQNPPAQVKQILDAKIAELDSRLQSTDTVANDAQPAAPAPQSSVKIHITLAERLTNKVPPRAILFVLARTGQGGPPLAVRKISAPEFPLTVELSDQDAMIAGHTLSSADKIVLVARLSRSGAPQPQSGDLEGKVPHAAGAAAQVNLTIDSLIP